MINCIVFVNGNGEIVLRRFFRDGVEHQIDEKLRKEVVEADHKKNKFNPPIKFVDGKSILHVKFGEIYIFAITNFNTNATLMFQYLYKLKEVLKSYHILTEKDIKCKITSVLEVLEETLDFGYPQNCTPDVLNKFLSLSKTKRPLQDISNSQKDSSQTSNIVDWRRENIKYKINEMVVDVMETANFTLSSYGDIIKGDISGRMNMRCRLSGMPECKLRLNDKLDLRMKGKNKSQLNDTSVCEPVVGCVDLENCTFHRCVKLGNFEKEGVISFIPPDGEFELMRYRLAKSQENTFRIVSSVTEHGKSKVSYNIKLTSLYPAKISAKPICFKIPCPNNTARAKLEVSHGKAKHDPAQHSILWKISKLPGKVDASFAGDVELMVRTKESTWLRPPIEVDFTIPTYAATGLEVCSMKVVEESRYKTEGSVLYTTKSGQFQIRI